MKKVKILKFDHVSEINILIEIISHYKSSNSKSKIVANENIDPILDNLIQIQKMFMEDKSV